MNIKSTFLVSIVFLFFASCANNEPVSAPSVEPIKHGSSMKVVADSTAKFTAGMVNNKRDFICGMPVTAGIADTAHYKGKVYGFCASECKAEFMKSPDSYTAKK